MAGAPRGGAELFFERLALALGRHGVEQHLVIRREPGRAARLRAAGLPVTELPFGGMLDFRTGPGLRRAVAAFAPRIVLSWMNRATQFCPHGDFVHVARLGGYYDLKYYRGCNYLIGNTRGIVDYIRNAGWPAARVHYLPNFVTLPAGEPAARAALATPADAPLVLALGRLHPNKGFDVLIEAVAQVARCYLWLAGDGPERAALTAQAQRLGVAGRVHFLGWRDDVAALYAAADLFVCSSRVEPLGNVVIEAWAAGKPVIAAAAAGPRELIADGKTGRLVPLEDAVALASAIAQLAGNSDVRRRLAAAGHAAYEAEFSEAHVVSLYRAFFDRVTR
jgi:glycosyltransferase involved in cell wall biosynthesis